MCEQKPRKIKAFQIDLKNVKPFLITNGKKYGIQTVFESNMDSEAIIVAFRKYKAESVNDEIDKMISFEKKNIEDLSKYNEQQDLSVVDLLIIVINDGAH